MTLKKKTFSDDEVPLFDNAVLYKRGEFWQMRMWLPNEHKYARKPITRAERVANAQSNIYTFLNEKQRDFISFILRNYVQDGVDELDISKLSASLTSKYGALHEAQRVLGNVEQIRNVFVEFQQHLYAVKVA